MDNEEHTFGSTVVAFTLTGVPAPATSLRLAVNGAILAPTTQFSVASSRVTMTSYSVLNTDTVIASYRY